MPSVLSLDRDLVGPGEPVRLTLLDQAVDFTDPGISSQLLVGLDVPRPSRSSGTLTHIVSNWSVVGRYELEIRVDQVGPRTRGLVPPGSYDVFARAGRLWSGDGDRRLRIQATPTAARAVSLVPPLTVPTVVRLFTLRLGLAVRALPGRIGSGLVLAYSGVVRAFLGMAMRNPSLWPLVPGGGPGAPAAGGPPVRGGGARARGGATRAPTAFLQPFADGASGFPRIHSLVGAADRLCFIATWGFDEAVRWSAAGQNDTGTPTAEAHLKARAVAMARLAESRVPISSRARVYSNMRVLLWDATVDDDYGGSGNDIGGLSVSWVRWNDVRRVRRAAIGRHLRDAGLSGESHDVLAEVHRAYRRMNRPEPMMPYPSGVMATTQNHSTASVLGSHHQKFVLTEDAAYVGGLNFHKDYWDDRGHRHVEPGRDSSKGLGSGSGHHAPLHDTGAILRSEDVQRRLLRLFAARWDRAIRRAGPYEGLVRRLHTLRHRTNDRADRVVYDDLVRYLERLPRTLVGGPWMGVTFATAPIPNAEVSDLRVAFTLPRGTAWATGGGVTEVLAEYRSALARTGGPLSTVLIETQYFQDARIALELFRRWSVVGGAREVPYAHIIIPYVPDTHWADISIPGLRKSEHDRIVTAEFQNIRWLELRTMKRLLEPDAAGRWVARYDVGDPAAQVRIVGAAHDDPAQLTPDTEVEVQDAFDLDNQVRIARLTRRVGDILTLGDICGYTLATDDAPAPGGGDPRSRQRDFLEEHGIYVHSKCAVFVDEDDPSVDRATAGSANLNARSLDDGGEQDSEANVWWSHERRVREFFLDLCAEHLNERDPSRVNGTRMQDDGLESLNRIRSGHAPACHLVRIDVADRLAHLV